MPDLFLATVNAPGYLPMSDERYVYRDAVSAWGHLVDERERDLSDPMSDEDDGPDAALEEIDGYVDAPDVGSVWGCTPGSDSEHDLGLVYSVTLWQHSGYPHEAGRLYDCQVCEYTCHCTADEDTTQCVHCTLIDTGESTCEDGECDADH